MVPVPLAFGLGLGPWVFWSWPFGHLALALTWWQRDRS